MKILLVDDDEFSREFMYKVVSKYGECDMAVNGLEAVEAFILSLEENKPYDVVFLDIMLPILSGTQVLNTIRRVEKDKKIDETDKVNVAITSALYDPIQVEELKSQGYEKYFRKPIEIGEILSFLESLQK